MDDGLLVGEESELHRVLDFLTTRFAALGLRVNMTKCCIWSPEDYRLPDCPVPTPSWDEPKIVLDLPFGSPVAEEAFLKQEMSKQRKFLDKLRRFPDPQVALPLLRMCLGPKGQPLISCLVGSPCAGFRGGD